MEVTEEIQVSYTAELRFGPRGGVGHLPVGELQGLRERADILVEVGAGVRLVTLAALVMPVAQVELE